MLLQTLKSTLSIQSEHYRTEISQNKKHFIKWLHQFIYSNTSNVTGRHQRPKQKLRAGYRVPALQHTSYFIVECGITCFLCTTQSMHLFEDRASSSSPRLSLCQILFLSWPPLLN